MLEENKYSKRRNAELYVQLKEAMIEAWLMKNAIQIKKKNQVVKEDKAVDSHAVKPQVANTSK